MPHADWRKLVDHLHTRYLTTSLAESAALATAIAEAAHEPASAPPARQPGPGSAELRLGQTFVDVKVQSPDVANLISVVAAGMGVHADPTQVTVLEIGLDTADREAIGPFWAAVLTGDASTFDEIDIMDPTGRFDTLWLQKTDPHETPRQRFHFDLWLPPEVVASRIEAAVAAGGTVVSTDKAPAFVVLADPQGNKVCLCTSEGRS
jgi:4a-hydroxytetrahydrobiopterin dehydratase